MKQSVQQFYYFLISLKYIDLINFYVFFQKSYVMIFTVIKCPGSCQKYAVLILFKKLFY